MSSPEIKGGDLVAIDNIRKGRIVGRAMYSDGRDVFVRIIEAFDRKRNRIGMDSPYLAAPVNYPGLKLVKRPEKPIENQLPGF